MRVVLLFAVVLAAGCAAPEPVSFADALGQPGCHLQLPDGSDALCHPNEQPLESQAGPPSAAWVCTQEFREPSVGLRYAIYRSLMTGEHAIAFEDPRLPRQVSGIVRSDEQPGYIGKWNGTNPAFVPLGRSVESVGIIVYDFRTEAEGDAQRAVVRERWTEVDDVAWLSYEVTFEDQTYTLRGMDAVSMRGDLVSLLRPLDVGNEAGRLLGDFTDNGGVAFGFAGLLPDESCASGM